MRLLHVKTLEPVEFISHIPDYAILSHTWEEEEVSYEELVSPNKSWQGKAGWSKIKAAARQAASNGHEYIWIDTCCIDKKSSAELQEAINSMFKWYKNSRVCYAYLSDVVVETTVEESSFRHARWFTRGWTLQELLAPVRVVFFDETWAKIGTKYALMESLVRITKICHNYLIGVPLCQASVAERMSWVAGRYTTREEDIAYCMLGIFDIHMPLLYGEGQRAFRRLQEEIMKASEDATLLAWGSLVYEQGLSMPFSNTGEESVHLLAATPRAFAGGDSLRAIDPSRDSCPAPYNHFFMTQRGLQITLDVAEDPNFENLAYGVLNCGCGDDKSSLQPLAFPIYLPTESNPIPEGFAFVPSSFPFTDLSPGLATSTRTVCLRRGVPIHDWGYGMYRIRLSSTVEARYTHCLTYPPFKYIGFGGNFPAKKGVLPKHVVARFLIWLQDSERDGSNILIRVDFLQPPISDRSLDTAEWKATKFGAVPTAEFFINNLQDDEFWTTAERCRVYDVVNNIIPIHGLLERVTLYYRFPT